MDVSSLFCCVEMRDYTDMHTFGFVLFVVCLESCVKMRQSNKEWLDNSILFDRQVSSVES